MNKPIEMMFECGYSVHKVKIYDISYDKDGFPLFLIYFNGQWIRKSAKYFKPIDWGERNDKTEIRILLEI